MSKDSPNENASIKIPKDFIEDYKLRLKYENKYRARYNELAKGGKNLEAVAMLSSIRGELERISKEKREKVLNDVEFIKSELALEVADTGENKDVRKMNKQLDALFSFENSAGESISKGEVLAELKKLFDKYKLESYSTLKSDINLFLPFKREADQAIIHSEALGDTIKYIIENDYPNKVRETTEEEVKEKQRKKPGRKTPKELTEDIQEILKQATKIKDMFTGEGRLVINRVLEYAMENKAFYNRWVDGGIKDYSERQLKKLFKREYEKMNK